MEDIITMYSVIKRDGKTVEFNLSKISTAITQAFDACERQAGGGKSANGRGTKRDIRKSYVGAF